LSSMSTGSTIGFVGGGVMAEAIIKGILAKRLYEAGQVVVGEPVASRRDYLAQTLGVRVEESNARVVQEAQVVVLAVKPQALSGVLADLAGQMSAETLLLSIVAGGRIERMYKALGVRAIVRIMPNTPAQVGEGVSAWTATAETNAEQRDLARRIMECLGEEVWVEDEDHIDMATGLSGSGPAYVFLFLEALIDVGVQMGFTRPVAEKLALQTVKGSAAYAQKAGLHPALLRGMVTSPGGTTAEGLFHLERGALRATIAEAVLAAYHKAQYLGSLNNE
jgi:pyrroline-5-carboxylate reductase